MQFRDITKRLKELCISGQGLSRHGRIERRSKGERTCGVGEREHCAGDCRRVFVGRHRLWMRLPGPGPRASRARRWKVSDPKSRPRNHRLGPLRHRRSRFPESARGKSFSTASSSNVRLRVSSRSIARARFARPLTPNWSRRSKSWSAVSGSAAVTIDRTRSA